VKSNEDKEALVFTIHETSSYRNVIKRVLISANKISVSWLRK